MSHVLYPILLKLQDSVVMQSKAVKLLQPERTSLKGACSAVAADEKSSRAECACAAQHNVGLNTPGRALTLRSREPFPAVVGRYQVDCSK